MRFRFTESFPEECAELESTVALIRKIVDDRLAQEIARLGRAAHSERSRPKRVSESA